MPRKVIRAPKTDKEAVARGKEVRRRMVAKGLPLERPDRGPVTGPPSLQSLRRGTIPGSAPAQRRPVRSTPSFNPVQRKPGGGGGRSNPTIFSAGKLSMLQGQARDRATLGIGFKGGLTRQGLSAKLGGVGRDTTRAKQASSPAVRDPFQAANEKRIKEGKPMSRAAFNALGRS